MAIDITGPPHIADDIRVPILGVHVAHSGGKESRRPMIHEDPYVEVIRLLTENA